MPEGVERALQLARPLLPLLGVEPVGRVLRSVAGAATGPSAAEREAGAGYVWGEATDGERTVVTRLRTPEPYALTVDAATTAAERVLAGDRRRVAGSAVTRRESPRCRPARGRTRG